jgi:hypothetical protein
MTEIYTINNVDIAQLHNEIVAHQNIHTNLICIDSIDDEIYIIFENTITNIERLVLNSIVNNHVPEVIEDIELERNIDGCIYIESLCIGSGEYNVTVMSNSNLESGTWITCNHKKQFNMFQGTGADNCLYIGQNEAVVGCKFDINSVSANTSKDDIIWEYWDGNNWSGLSHMNTLAVAPFSYRDLSVVSYAEMQNIRFNVKKYNSNMSLKNLNGHNLYWVRMRIINNISAIPVANSVFTHISDTKFTSEGFLEFFGNARPVKRLPWTLGDTEPANSSPGNQDLYLSDRLGVGLKENEFYHGTVDRLGLNIFLPHDIDTSFPLKFKFAIVGDSNTAGNVELVCRWNISNQGSDVYWAANSAPTESPNEMSASTLIAINEEQKEFRGEIPIDLSRINPCPENSPPPLLTLTVERDSSSSNSSVDTYDGDIAFFQMSPFYVAWRVGGYLECY